MYCGEVVDISQPLLPMGMKTPSCISIELRVKETGETAHCPPWKRI